MLCVVIDMSRIGKKAIVIPAGVKVQVNGQQVTVEGPKGKSSVDFHSEIGIRVIDGRVEVSRARDDKEVRALHGMVRSTIQNMVKGVTEEFEKSLQIEGVGFKAQVSGQTLQLSLGFSHPINYTIPSGVKVETPKPTIVMVKGVDRWLVGQVASNIRRFFEPEPYKGKGVRFTGEQIRRKKGKTVQ